MSTQSAASPDAAPPLFPPDRRLCADCRAVLTGPFCARCGQKVLADPPTVRDILHEAAGELLSIDGKVFRTLRLLITRPGFVTRELFDGRRASYVRPLRLYVACSVAALGVMALVPDQGQADEQFLELLPPFMFIMVPVFALIVMLVMRTSGRTYPQHLYFALHLHTVVFAVTALTVPFDLAASQAVRGLAVLLRVGLTLAYGVAALRTAYGVGWGAAAMRAAVILAAYLTWMVVLIAGALMAYAKWWSL